MNSGIPADTPSSTVPGAEVHVSRHPEFLNIIQAHMLKKIEGVKGSLIAQKPIQYISSRQLLKPTENDSFSLLRNEFVKPLVKLYLMVV
jgi:hypothetical protein